MDKHYRLYNEETKEIECKTLPEILHDLNRGRSDHWEDYDETDWKEGLTHFTEYTLLEETK